MNGETSETLPVISGVPQDSVLGPLLFLIYIDDVMRVPLSEGSRLTVYADDMLLYKPVSCLEDFTALQNDIDKLESWTTSNLLHFNTSKCKFMVVSRKRTGVVPHLSCSRVSNFSKLITLSTWGSYCRQTCLGLLMLKTYVAELENYLGCCIGSITSWLSRTPSFNCTYPSFGRISNMPAQYGILICKET